MTNKYEDAINFYIENNEYSIAKVAKKFGVDRLRLGELLRNFGIDTNARRRKFSLNESYFETIDSEEKAYWLGFILADPFAQTEWLEQPLFSLLFFLL